MISDDDQEAMRMVAIKAPNTKFTSHCILELFEIITSLKDELRRLRVEVLRTAELHGHDVVNVPPEDEL